MFTANSRLFPACSKGAQLMKRLAQNILSDRKNLRISTRVMQRSKKGFEKDVSSGVIFSPVKVQPCKEVENVGEELTGKIEKGDLLKLINTFIRSNEVKILAAENGLDEGLCEQGFLNFRKYCLESKILPADLHIILSDIINGAGNVVDIFPFFLRFVREMFPHLDYMDDLKKIGDIREPAAWYPEARSLKRKFYFHCGPTNSGKTHHAIQKFFSSESGIYCAPLKLLAVEVHNKANKLGTPCDLYTGDEIIFIHPQGNHSNHLSCTIEMCPLDKICKALARVDVAIIDEIQMLKDNQRGWAWTRALLGLRAKEIHLCGEEAAVNLVDSILCTTNEELVIKKYNRLTKLSLDEPIDSLDKVRDGDCLVCFNKIDIFRVAQELENLGHKVAIVYGSLPPNTKLTQCEKFNDPNDPCKVLVATDAIGMGLNLNIRRIIFYSMLKSVLRESGEIEKGPISVSQALQIGGRAGRYGTSYEEGYVTTFRRSEFNILNHLFNQEPEIIDRSGLLPTVDQIELFSYYLPNSSLYELMGIFESVCTLDNSLYFICNIREFKFLSQMIDHVPLPLKVKYVFCCAPVDRRFHFLCVMFIKFAKMFSLNQAVTVSWICNTIKWPLSKPTNLRELEQLEVYYEALDLYLWLSNRFEDFFPDGPVIRKMQSKIDELVQEKVHSLAKMSAKSRTNVDKGGTENVEEENRNK